MLDMLDFEGREEVSYDELAICISTVIGALSKVIFHATEENETHVKRLVIDDALSVLL